MSISARSPICDGVSALQLVPELLRQLLQVIVVGTRSNAGPFEDGGHHHDSARLARKTVHAIDGAIYYDLFHLHACVDRAVEHMKDHLRQAGCVSQTIVEAAKIRRQMAVLTDGAERTYGHGAAGGQFRL